MSKTLIVVTALLLVAGRALAAPPDGMSPEALNGLAGLRQAVTVRDDNAQAGVITKAQFDQGAKRYLEQAARIAGRPVTLDQLMAVTGDPAAAPVKLTALQRFAGLITFVNVIWVLAIGLGVLCFAFLFGSLVRDLIKMLVRVPIRFYEVVFYLLSAGLLVLAWFLGPTPRPYVALTGCLTYAAAVGFSLGLRKEKRIKSWQYPLLLAALWIPAALVFDSSLIGFIATAAVLAALGFSVLVTPLCYSFGFDDETSLGRATTAAFALLAGFVLLRVFGAAVPGLRVFESGALFLGSFVGYLGLLICSSRWYTHKKNYALFQVVTIAAGVAALLVGSLCGIGELQKIGGTFFVLYLLEKPFEIPVESKRAYATIGLVVSAALFGFCWYVRANPDVFRSFLFMP